MKVAIVTGAGSGVGRASAEALAVHGFAVVLAGRRRVELDETAAIIATRGGEVIAVPTDISDEAQVDALFARAVDAFGRVDLLFNNAGMGAFGPIEEVSVESWRQVFDVNVTGVFLCTRAAVRQMKAQAPQGGRIINNGSISAHVPRMHSSVYTASKHAVSGLTKATALEGRAFNIACGQIDIGNAVTPMLQGGGPGALQPDMSLKPEPNIDVAEVARAVAYMASLPLGANVLTMTVMATGMPYVGRG
ncbi:SDR family oxidoreductase [Sphingomonas sp. LB-2]|uniref:SDR family oxidoreductase n=1 Tax=Sphingomonas caeni TaxID=2984949 RepID=UPI00222F3969|nr:SDR family oxidoreductase [Sphingomonas caeni]MCW3848518.1 SDR family oxidoreductase [Sphingomonas caeni]